MTKTKNKEEPLYIDINTILEALNLQGIININDFIEQETDGLVFFRVRCKKLIELINNHSYFDNNHNKITGTQDNPLIGNITLN